MRGALVHVTTGLLLGLALAGLIHAPSKVVAQQEARAPFVQPLPGAAGPWAQEQTVRLSPNVERDLERRRRELLAPPPNFQPLALLSLPSGPILSPPPPAAAPIVLAPEPAPAVPRPVSTPPPPDPPAPDPPPPPAPAAPAPVAPAPAPPPPPPQRRQWRPRPSLCHRRPTTMTTAARSAGSTKRSTRRRSTRPRSPRRRSTRQEPKAKEQHKAKEPKPERKQEPERSSDDHDNDRGHGRRRRLGCPRARAPPSRHPPHRRGRHRADCLGHLAPHSEAAPPPNRPRSPKARADGCQGSRPPGQERARVPRGLEQALTTRKRS